MGKSNNLEQKKIEFTISIDQTHILTVLALTTQKINELFASTRQTMKSIADHQNRQLETLIRNNMLLLKNTPTSNLIREFSIKEDKSSEPLYPSQCITR